jgi:hypothetical protein
MLACRAGTPVSFRLVRTCAQDGKTYPVLTQSNTQGPPGTTECRCPNAQGPQLQVLQVASRVQMQEPASDPSCCSRQDCLKLGTRLCCAEVVQRQWWQRQQQACCRRVLTV